MKIIVDNPPNIAEIDAVFHVKDRPAVYFCWGEFIYNPSGLYIPEELVAHEEVHSYRQRAFDDSPQTWWNYYLRDPQFRFDEELPAHIAEYKFYLGTTKLKPRHAKYLDMAAERLSGELYGNVVSFAKARQMIRDGARED